MQFIGEKYRISLLSNEVVRLEYSETGTFVDSKTQSVINREIEQIDKIEYDVVETEEILEIYSPKFHLYYQKEQPFSKKSLYIDFNFAFYPHGNRWYFGDEFINLKGTTRTLDEVDGAIPLEDGVMSFKGFTILDDSNSQFINEVGDIVRKDFDSIDIYALAFGHDYNQGLQTYFKLTGFSPKLPRYALGNWWSRYWKYTEESYKELVETFKAKNIPLSVAVIDMDWHLTQIPERFGSSWTGYTWNKDYFPNPERFLKWLHDEGLAISINLHPADGVRAYEDCYPAVAKRLKLNTEIEEPAIFDFTDEAFREAYFKDVMHPLEEQGVDFFWIDWQQGTEINGLDPLLLLNHYHFKDMEDRGKEPLILSRYAGPGSHRYPIGFSGDSFITWDSLQFQPYMTSTATNIGYTWWSHDIGGHMNGYRDDELMVRWVQYGVFSPINRLHSSNSLFTGKEPWSYPLMEEMIIADYLRKRHELLPYLYTFNVLTAEEGIPLIRPLYYEESDNLEVYQYDNEYYFGTELLVLPITSKLLPDVKMSKEKIYFPEGEWYDVHTNLRYKGGASLDIYRGLSEMPVFAKAGAIIPMDLEPVENMRNDLPTDITWKIYPGPNNQFELIEEVDHHRAVTTVVVEDGVLSLTIDDPENILPEGRQHHLVFSATEAFEVEGYPAIADEQLNTVTISMTDSAKIELLGFEKIEKQDIEKRLFEILNQAQVKYWDKEKLWFKFHENKSDLQYLSIIQSIDSEDLKAAVFELIYILNS